MKLPWFSGSEETLISTAQGFASNPKALPLDAIIPPALPGRARTLVLCFDGTGDKCVLLFHCLKRTDINKSEMMPMWVFDVTHISRIYSKLSRKPMLSS
jgi:hypothetical protein